jgi:phosphoglycerate dehydrogenase-like enzyme
LTPNTVRVACLGYVFDPLVQQIVEELAPPGFELLFAEKPDETTPGLVVESDFVMCVSHVTDSMMANAPRLRLIQKWGIGVDKIDLEAADRHGIYVAITAGANASVVAEHTIMLILASLRRLVVADRSMRAGGWSAAELRPKTRQLATKTVGILGLGNIGTALARRLRGFEVRILYRDIKGPFDIGKEFNAEFVSFDELLRQSDILTLHIPGGKANRHVIDANANALARMKPDSVLINAARSELIDEIALTNALTSGHLLGAACDTFENEPLSPESPLRRMDSMVMTPHCAGGVLDHIGPMAEHAFRNLQLFLRDEPLAEGDWIVVPDKPRRGYTALQSKPT